LADCAVDTQKRPNRILLGLVSLVNGIATYAEPKETINSFSTTKQVNPAIAVGIISFLIAIKTFFLLPLAMLILYRGNSGP
jgi:hypothetical protein